MCINICSLFAGGYFNFVKEFTSGNVSYLRQDVKPLLAIVTMKSDEAPLYLYYGSLTAYSYYSRIYNLPEAIAGTYPDNEKFSEKYLLTDLENLKGELITCCLLKVHGLMIKISIHSKNG